jgi:hypothetical protein
VEHTPSPDHLASPRPINERKWKPDGTVREYACHALHLDANLAIIEFRMERGGEIFGTPIAIPPGSVSHGYFWKRRPYNLYRMRGPDGAILAHRFDAVADVKLHPDAVEYRDLVLDWWVTADDILIEEDRDEMDALVASGAMGAADVAHANAAARAIFSRYRHIIDDVAILERRLGLA